MNCRGKMKKWAEGLKTRSFRVGGYSIAVTAVVLAIAVAVNLLASALPSTWTKFDTTSFQLYSISEQTEKVVKGLDTQVEIYWIVQSGKEDQTLQTFLERYTDLSNRVKLIKKDPDVYPTFAQQYTTQSVTNNCLVVQCGERARFISNSEIYVYDYTNYYYTGTYDVSFDGESALTSAIAYVTNEDLPKVYVLNGHNELELPQSYQDAIEKENMEVASLTLLTLEEIPADADCVVLCAPESDISREEKAMLEAYLAEGGRFFLLTDPAQEGVSFTNLEELMAAYGVKAQPGIVVEGSQNNYAYGMPYYLLPNQSSHEITEPLMEAGYYVLLPVAGGLTTENVPSGVYANAILTTSSSAFSKLAGYGLTTYEKEEGDISGKFALTVAIKDYNSDSRLVWVSSAALVDESCNERVSGGNLDFFLNCLGWMCGQEQSISIHAKSFSQEYLTISSAEASMLSVLMVFVLPGMLLATGIVIWIRRKRR